jgi:hypothetical protein
MTEFPLTNNGDPVPYGLPSSPPQHLRKLPLDVPQGQEDSDGFAAKACVVVGQFV